MEIASFFIMQANIEDIRLFALSFPTVEESFPFDDSTLVFKVEGKMFLVIPLEAETPLIIVKCDSEKAQDLRAKYEAVKPAWHFNKLYWNMIELNSDMGKDELKRWIRHSFSEVVKKLPKYKQENYSVYVEKLF